MRLILKLMTVLGGGAGPGSTPEIELTDDDGVTFLMDDDDATYLTDD